jgi:transcriptional regulator with XRE-family HTH domain
VEASDIGSRVRMIRKRRGMSLDVAAGLAGISKPYLSQLETGKRSFERRGLLDDIAGVLGCSVADLTGQPYLPPDRDTADTLANLPGVSLAVYDCTLDDVPDLPARPVDQLATAARAANAYLDGAQFSMASRGLGAIMTELHVHGATGDADTRREAWAALAEICIVGTSVARHLGQHELAIQTARRGYDAAKRLDDPTLIGSLAVQCALGLTWIGARRRVTEVLEEAESTIRPVVDPSAKDTGPAEAAGMLYLTAALNHAHIGQAADADLHLDRAKDLATHTGEQNTLYQHFGPAHVALWDVEMAVELGRGPSVVQRVEPHAEQFMNTLGSANRRCVFAFDMARAYAQSEGDFDTQAVRYLDMSDRASKQVRNVPVAREMLDALNRRAKRRAWELQSLSNRFGLN